MAHQEARWRVEAALLNVLEDVAHRARDDPRALALVALEALHRVGLPGAGLAIRDHRCVEALERRLDRGPSGAVEHERLVAVRVEDVVKLVGVCRAL